MSRRRAIAPRRRGARRRARAGLTLVEVMVAIAILLLMMVMTTAVLANALTVRQILEDRDTTTRSARVALGTIRRQLQLAYLTELQSANFSYQTVFVGIDGSTDSLYFATRGHQRLYRDSRESDQAEVTLWAEPGRGSDSRGYVLYHRESARVDEEPDEDGRVLPLATHVRSFELRFLDGQQDEWRDEWDSRSPDYANRLPRAVQVGLVLIGVDPANPERTVDLPFFTTVLLAYADPLPRLDLGVGVGGIAAPPGGNTSMPTTPTTGFGRSGGASGGGASGGASRGGASRGGR